MDDLQFQELGRDELERVMERITTTPLTILAAPMGYGKTVALKNFLGRHPESVQFVFSMEKEEEETDWFWKKLCAKLEPFLAEEDQAAWLAGVPQNSQDIDRLLKSMRKHVSEGVYVVLDDFHKCNNQALNQLLERIVYEDIYGLHIILSGQTYPELAYEEMQVKGYCQVINQYMMTLSREEVGQLFRINGIALSEEELEYAYSYSAGWVSAVYLLILDYWNRGQLQCSFSIYHLMKTAIYDHLPEQLKEALMKISPLPEFGLKELNYVAETRISEVMLQRMEEQFGFLRYDAHSGHYKMHTLLRSLAMEELEKSGKCKEAAYQRAAFWNESQGNDIEALSYYKRAGSKRDVFRLLERREEAQMNLLESTPGLLKDFFGGLEEEEALSHPVAYFRYLYHLFLSGEKEEGLPRFERAKEWFERKAAEDPSFRKDLGELYILETVVRFNNLEEINACMEKAKELREGIPSEVFATRILTYGSPDTLLLYHRIPGKLQEAIVLEKQYCKAYSWLINRLDSDWDNMTEAEYRVMTGNFAEARQLARQACAKAELRRQICVGLSCFLTVLRSDIALGDTAAFDSDVHRLEIFMKGVVRKILLQDYDQVLGFVYGILGRLEEIPGWLREDEMDQCNYMVRSVRSGCIVYAKYLVRKKFWDRLEIVADRMVVPYGRTEHVFVEIYSGCFKAIAVSGRQKEPEAGIPYLERSLELARADGIRLPFVEECEALLPLLRCMDQKDFFIRQITEDCRKYQENLALFGKKKNVHLTPREIELMNLVRDGCRNQEISKKLNIAAVTVEKTLTNVYRKLNVSNRVAAVKQMEELFGG